MKTPEYQPVLISLLNGIPAGRGFRRGVQNGVVWDYISIYLVESIC